MFGMASDFSLVSSLLVMDGEGGWPAEEDTENHLPSAHTLKQSRHLLMWSGNGILYLVSQRKRQEQIDILSFWNRISLRLRKCAPWWHTAEVWKYVLSGTGLRVNEDCYLFPVQQFRSILITLIPQCFGSASACAPAHTNTHSTQYEAFPSL